MKIVFLDDYRRFSFEGYIIISHAIGQGTIGEKTQKNSASQLLKTKREKKWEVFLNTRIFHFNRRTSIVVTLNCGILHFLCTITYHYALTISNLPHKLSRCCCACFVNFEIRFKLYDHAASLYHLLTGLAISSQDCQGSKNITLFLCCYCFQFMYQVTHRRGGNRQIESRP